MADKLFGTDGIRDTANTNSLTPVSLARLGQAIGLLLKNRPSMFSVSPGTQVPRVPYSSTHAFRRPNVRDRVLIGRDTRPSGPMISASLAGGLLSQGINVAEGGLLPTPAIAHVVRTMDCLLGVVISASHNPAQDNGIKLVSPEGFKIPDLAEEQIESLVRSGVVDAMTGPCVGDFAVETGFDPTSKMGPVLTKYARDLLDRFASEGLSLKGLKLVVDCANGAMRACAPWVLRALGAEVDPIGVDSDGSHINDGCGALHPEVAAERVRTTGADLGLAFDGDGDRLIVIDDAGVVRDGDFVLAVSARHLKALGRLDPPVVVGTEMSNLGLEVSFRTEGIRLVRARVGDRHVSQEMQRSSLILGGEQSGHVIYFEDATTGDGLLTALRVLQAIRYFKKPWSVLCGCMNRLPQVLRSIRVLRRPSFESLSSIVTARKRIEKRLGSNGRLVLRYSGTEPVARVMIEGSDQRLIETMADSLVRILGEELG